MAGIPKRFIRDIIDMTDIISLVEKYVPLTKKGKDHWGLCPFCEDGKNPSFSVSQQKQFYYCFKCRSTGNVIGFLEQYSGLNFVESIETLASLNSIEVPYEDSPKRAEGREDIYDALDKATIFYESYLSNEASAEKVRKYLNEERK
ncbi:MAG: CHC2 zinc finger domain-containing protein, partial [Pseudomonadota bacterium]|nr:CHC2 zinc finger domain-containing protein [Pseudomonadota bacterium]